MSGYRFDEITECWVAVASARRGLPVDARVAAADGPVHTPEGGRPCPFCPGHESELEATEYAVSGPDGRWRVRVVRNRYPIVRPDANEPEASSVFREVAPRGIHELVIESPAHDADWSGYEPTHGARVVDTYRHRLRELEAAPGMRHVALFRNSGRRAGSSQSHPHAQLVAVSVLPEAVERRAHCARRHAERTGRVLLDDLLARELAAGARVVELTDAFAVLCPFASHRAFETWIVPRVSGPSFAALGDDLLAPFASLLARTVARVRRATRDAAYNLVVRTPPVGAWSEPGASWHLEVLPRTGGDAGFELTTGVDVVPVAPEDAAAELRAIVLPTS